MSCTPYPVTVPCETTAPVTVNPYLPTRPPLPEDELARSQVQAVPEPSALVLTALALAALARCWRPAR